MKVEDLALDQLTVDPANVRKHDKRNIETIKGSLARWGLQKPIVVDKDGVVVAGNGTVKAARLLGWTSIRVVRSELIGAERTAYAIADNRSSELAEWDDGLAEALAALQNDELVDVDVTGFIEAEIEQLINESLDPTAVTEDEVPEPPVEPVTRPGDLWTCGEHRVLCGDSTKAEDVGRCQGDATFDACVTDPPYGVGIDYGAFQDSQENAAQLVKKVMPLLLKLPCAALTPGVHGMWHYPRPAWVGTWVHPAPVGRCPWGFVGNNPILYYGKDPYLQTGRGSRPDSLVLACGREEQDGHPTPKPMKVWCWLVERVTPKSGLLVFDPFLGSGTTMIAAEQLGRRCFGIEISSAYVDVCCRRFLNQTGQSPVRESDGAKFAELVDGD